MKTILWSGIFAMIMLAVGASAVGAQQRPALSVATGTISINYEACLARARQALESEGFSAERGGGNFYWGGKGIHSATIVCDGTQRTDGKIDFHVWVASNSNDGNVTGAERVRLGLRMDGATSVPPVTAPTWGSNVIQYRGQNTRVAFDCPAGGSLNNIWGTDIYTDDSSVCTAAVHAGLITFASGGRVTIETRPGAASYTRSSRNGITTGSYGSWGGSFVFVR